jgi:hypothetical protein
MSKDWLGADAATRSAVNLEEDTGWRTALLRWWLLGAPSARAHGTWR